MSNRLLKTKVHYPTRCRGRRTSRRFRLTPLENPNLLKLSLVINQGVQESYLNQSRARAGIERTRGLLEACEDFTGITTQLEHQKVEVGGEESRVCLDLLDGFLGTQDGVVVIIVTINESVELVQSESSLLQISFQKLGFQQLSPQL